MFSRNSLKKPFWEAFGKEMGFPKFFSENNWVSESKKTAKKPLYQQISYFSQKPKDTTTNATKSLYIINT
jgi:hypothetical protein